MVKSWLSDRVLVDGALRRPRRIQRRTVWRELHFGCKEIPPA